jgi:glycosyl transferase family 87
MLISAETATAEVPGPPSAAAEAPAQRWFRAPSPGALRAAGVCVLLYIAGLFLRDAVFQFSSIDWAWAGSGDAAVDWGAAKLYWQDVSPYTPEGLALVGVKAFGHPPTTPFWFLPLTELDLPTLGKVLGIFNFGLALALVALVVFSLGLPAPYAVTALVFGAIQSLPPALEHAQVIQISVWIAFAYALAWRWLRKGHDIKAGFALGLACTLKLFPGVVVLFLLFSGRLRAVAASIVAFLIVAGLMTFRWGFGAWLLFFEQQDVIARRWLLDARNASLHGAIRRSFGRLCEAAPFDHVGGKVLAIAASLGLLVLALWVARRARSRQAPQTAFDRSFALFSVVSAFINPWIWEHYFYLLVLPALVGVHAVSGDVGVLYRRWAQGKLGSARLALAVGAAGLASLPIWAAAATYQHHYNTGNYAIRAYCKHHHDAPVSAWLLTQIKYFAVVHWLPWLAFSVLFLVLLSYRAPLAPSSD